MKRLTKHRSNVEKRLPDECISLPDAVKTTGVCRRTIRRYQTRGLLPERYTWVGNLRVSYLLEQDIDSIASIRQSMANRGSNLAPFTTETRALRKELPNGR